MRAHNMWFGTWEFRSPKEDGPGGTPFVLWLNVFTTKIVPLHLWPMFIDTAGGPSCGHRLTTQKNWKHSTTNSTETKEVTTMILRKGLPQNPTQQPLQAVRKRRKFIGNLSREPKPTYVVRSQATHEQNTKVRNKRRKNKDHNRMEPTATKL